jgi:hypothetical protein
VVTSFSVVMAHNTMTLIIMRDVVNMKIKVSQSRWSSEDPCLTCTEKTPLNCGQCIKGKIHKASQLGYEELEIKDEFGDLHG